MPFAPFSLKLEAARVVPALRIAPNANLAGLGRALDIPQVRGAIAVVGGAAAFDEPEYALIRQKVGLFLDELAQIAIANQLVVVAGGTPFGVMKLLGEICRMYNNRFPLVGVAPSGKVDWQTGLGIDYAATWFSSVNIKEWLEKRNSLTPLDKNHTAFVLVEANEWGDEVEMLAAVAHELAGNNGTLEVLINGGEVARRDVKAYLQKGGQVIVVEGTGRFADELAQAVRLGFSPDPELQELLRSPNIHLCSVNDSPKVFGALLLRLGRWT